MRRLATLSTLAWLIATHPFEGPAHAQGPAPPPPAAPQTFAGIASARAAAAAGRDQATAKLAADQAQVQADQAAIASSTATLGQLDQQLGACVDAAGPGLYAGHWYERAADGSLRITPVLDYATLAFAVDPTTGKVTVLPAPPAAPPPPAPVVPPAAPGAISVVPRRVSPGPPGVAPVPVPGK